MKMMIKAAVPAKRMNSFRDAGKGSGVGLISVDRQAKKQKKRMMEPGKHIIKAPYGARTLRDIAVPESKFIGVTMQDIEDYDFLSKLVNIALPRVRDFRGVSQKGFDGNGNFSMGITEHIIFPEVDYDKIDKIRGLNVTIVTSAKTDDEGRALLRLLGMPFKQNKSSN